MQRHLALTSLLLTPLLFLALPACSDDHGHEHPAEDSSSDSTQGDEDAAPAADEHEHNEESLGTSTAGDMTVELAQGHGHVVPGGESQLVIKLPHNDQGATAVRAWLGTEDRTLSLVGLGEYAPSHDDYDVHVTAPDPLPSPLMWWFEIETPDGTKVLGSAAPLVK